MTNFMIGRVVLSVDLHQSCVFCKDAVEDCQHLFVKCLIIFNL